MTAAERREEIKKILSHESQAVSASNLAARFSVSRQVVVGDIALLRTAGMEIDATPRGYLLHKEKVGLIHQVVCVHDVGDQLKDELYTMVDYGCSVLNVIVEHPIYGTLTGELHIESRYDVELFAEKLAQYDAMPLSSLTEGIHTHTLVCSSEEGYEMMKKALTEKGYLLSAN